MWCMILLISLLSIVLLYFLLVFIRTIFSFVYLYVEHRLDTNSAHHGSLFQYIKIGLHEYWVMNLKLFMWLFDWSRDPKEVTGDTAIVLVHGFLRTPGDWLRFKRRLNKKTELPIFNLKLHPTLGPIQTIAENFGADLNALEKKHAIKNWYIIAHSMGGLISTYYVAHLDKEKHVKKVITLGSPYHGTKVSSLAIGDNAKQMHPHASFIAQLRNDIAQDQHFDLYQVATPYDNIVFPWQSCFTEPQFVTAQYTTKPMGHIALLYSKEVIAKVEEWLKETPNSLP